MGFLTNRKVMLRAAYVAFGFAAFFGSFYLTFPAEALGQRIAHEVQRQSKGKISFSFGDAELYRYSGLALGSVKLTVLRDGKEPLLLDFDRVAARVKILPLLLLRTAVHARLQLGGGTIDADFSRKGEVIDADIDIDDLDFTSPPVLPRLAGIPLVGKLDARGTIYLAEQANASTGSLTFELRGGAIGPGAAFGITVPQIGVGDLKAQIDLKDGKAKITSFDSSSGNVAFALSGEMSVKQKLEMSTIDVCAQVKADQAWLEKNDKMKTALMLAGTQFATDPTGYLNIPLRGTFGKPNVGKGVCKR